MTSTSAYKSTTILVALTSSASSGVVTAFSGGVVGILAFSCYNSNMLGCATAIVTTTTAIKSTLLILDVSPNVGTKELLLFLTCKLTSNISDIHSIYSNGASTASATGSFSYSSLWSSSTTMATATFLDTSLETSTVTKAFSTNLTIFVAAIRTESTNMLSAFMAYGLLMGLQKDLDDHFPKQLYCTSIVFGHRGKNCLNVN